jgi:FkbM family methyltransferase
MSINKLNDVLAIIGENESLRANFVEWCKKVENELSYKGSVRDDLTRFLVDAIYANVPLERKSVANGLTFEFIPNIHSKVAREFIMSTPGIPEYVWEPQTTKLLLYLSKNAKNVAIGGAYFGDQAVLVADLIKKNHGVVHAFDLNEKQLQVLARNVEINKLSNIKITHKGLWNDSNTYLNLSDDDDLAFASAANAEAGREANTITIDEYVKSNKLPGVDLIMLDIEGSEFKVLEGASEQLKQPTGIAPNIVFEVHRSYVDWSDGLHNTEIVQFLKSFGYTLFSLRDFQANYDLKSKVIELIRPEDTYLEGPPHGFNMLAIKDVSLIQNDLFSICKNVSPKYLVHKDPALHHPIDGLK